MPLQGNLSIERMCELARVSRASFYRSFHQQQPVAEELEVRFAIQQIAIEHRRRYGYRRISAELRRRGMQVKTHHHDCPHRSLPIQPQSHLSGFRLVPPRIGTMVEQPMAALSSGSVCQPHLDQGHPAGGTIPRTQFPGPVFRIQSDRPPLRSQVCWYTCSASGCPFLSSFDVIRNKDVCRAGGTTIEILSLVRCGSAPRLVLLLSPT